MTKGLFRRLRGRGQMSTAFGPWPSAFLPSSNTAPGRIAPPWRAEDEIVFPAGYLQPPNFNMTADPAVNYGAIGYTIGHEIGHVTARHGAQRATRAQNAGIASNSKEFERELLPYGDPRKLPPGFNARTQGIFQYWIEDGTFVKRTPVTRLASTSQRATQARRPDGTSTVTGVSGPVIGTRPFSMAHVTRAIVPWPQAVE